MSKAKRIREMQEKINRLESELERANKKIAEYQKRDKGVLRDFIKKKD